jgi:RNA polymerase sigma factor (sigma-70 family)
MNDVSNGSRLNLQQFLQENMGPIEGIVRSYVIRMGLAHGESIQNTTLDILNDATLEALVHAEAFEAVQQPRAWFLGIAVNMIKRKRAALARNKRHEYSVGMLVNNSEHEAVSESDFFDKISHLAHVGPEQEVENRAQVDELLALASPADRTILRLAFLQDLDTHNLALALNVSEGTVRVRLHRTLNRLRLAWQQHNKNWKG